MTKSAVPTAWLVLSSLCVIPQKWLKLLCQVSADRFYQGDSRSCITWAISINYSLPPSHQVNQQIPLTRVMASPQMSNLDLFKGLPGQVAVWQVKLCTSLCPYILLCLMARSVCHSRCLNACTYCKTKHARGDLASYPVEELVERTRQSFQGECTESKKKALFMFC